MFKHTILKAAVVAAISFAAVSAQATVLDATTVRAFGASSNAADGLYITDPRSSMSLVASISSDIIFNGDNIGDVVDQVWRNNSTNTLSFFTRVVMEDAGYEINDIVRSGFTGFTTDVSWFKESGSNLATQGFRLKSAGHTDSIGTAADVYKADFVNLRSDISVEEGKPTSGWYIINTNATAFTTVAGTTANNYGMFLRSTGEDVGAPASLFLSAFAPTVAVAAAVPEADTYMMMLAGLGLMGFAARRKQA